MVDAILLENGDRLLNEEGGLLLVESEDVRLLSLQDYNTSTPTPVQAIPDDATHFVVELLRSTAGNNTLWPDVGVSIEVLTEVSFDGGLNWVESGAFSAFGGIHIRRDGNEAKTSSMPVKLPSGSNRKFRATIIPSGNAKTACDFKTIKTQLLSGLDFQGSTHDGITCRFQFDSPFAFIPSTYIWRARPRQQVGYYTSFFHGEITSGASFDNTVAYVGGHPYPVDPPDTPNENSNVHKWEIAGDGGGDFRSTEFVVYDVFYTQVLRVSLNGGFPLFEYFWDWVNNKSVVHQGAQNFPPPPNPGIMFGDAPWNEGDEVYNGVLRGFQLYNVALTNTQINQELVSPGSAVTPWYLNLNPTVADITDKSGNAHHPQWIGNSRPLNWAG